MAFLELLAILLLIFILVPIFKNMYTLQKQKQTNAVIPTNWPVLGRIPGVLVNAHRLHDYATEALIHTHGTFKFKVPCFANMKMLVTTDPLNIHHILSKNFSNYPKGDKFRKIFSFFGDGILNADDKIWKINHKVVFSILRDEGFQRVMDTIIWNKVENGLMPVLESVCDCGVEVDLQDIFQRLTLDTVCKLLCDIDPQSLSLNFPSIPLSKAFTDVEEAILFRHLLPPSFWRLQQILKAGKEKKLSDASKTIDEFVYTWLNDKQKEYNNVNNDGETSIFYTAISREIKAEVSTSIDPTKFIKDTMVSLMVAGKDTISSALSWFFYLLARHPVVEDKILEEILEHLVVNGGGKRWSSKELDKMVYLHGALCESLRLYPPVPFNYKCPLKPEILPSGHRVDQNTNIILSFYSMGRMKSIWGEDCMEFKPERWISSTGGIKHEPSYKFPAFNAGPRTCLGKNMALSQLKMVSTSIICRYQIQLVEGHHVLRADSFVLQMKHGLKVRFTRRNELKKHED